ncbi:pyridoxal-dependent aspartate 1-decarboxylase PanP [Vibrio salinus]|uniref:pyridoxal-dependent aspartate 1-decarboxylase PanP n=1 Tax=Vibrio salinus TaxID=2899784 RepID=UPI001E4B5553|nr:putative pyridoxal-dependent aspartate 1-decarboxylase [Vibrio salinus]MCE0492754.1 putative pyridoxal-dependent aspartate 1-decarboxylase [Vibrio salinus]
MVSDKNTAKANSENLLKIFTVPEGPDSALTRIEEQISKNLNQFLKEHIVADAKSLLEIEDDFRDYQIPEQPQFVSEHTQQLMDKVISHSVHTSSPWFIGHMTSALPYFLMPLAKLMTALNQNTVKVETSKAFTPMERQVIGMLHELIFHRSSDFYHCHMHSANHSLGAICSGGTVANITALWVARNQALCADGIFPGVEKAGLVAAIQHYGYRDIAVLVSERGHYSLKKATDLLGIGQHNLLTIPTDEHNHLDLKALHNTITELKNQHILPIAVIAVAGTTETGSVDPINDIAEICEKEKIYFHVDAAWGGATLLSNRYRHLLSGIERADSVTIDAHKQLYLPMGAGMVIFKEASSSNTIEHHAQYILREGSKDLGSRTLEGSRPGMAMLIYSAMHIISRQGYELLINQSIEKTKAFADMIREQHDFELISDPELCILTYRYVPEFVNLSLLTNSGIRKTVNNLLNELTIFIQKKQREAGKSFVSRTLLNPGKWDKQKVIVFRVVLANPLTTNAILHSVLEEQRCIAQEATDILEQLTSLINH